MEAISDWWVAVLCWGVTLYSGISIAFEWNESKRIDFNKLLNPVFLLFYFGAALFTYHKGIEFTIIAIISVPLILWIIVKFENSASR